MPIPINPAAHPALSAASKWLPGGGAVCHQAAHWTLSPRVSQVKLHLVCQAEEVLEVLGFASSVVTLTPFSLWSNTYSMQTAAALYCNKMIASLTVCIPV